MDNITFWKLLFAYGSIRSRFPFIFKRPLGFFFYITGKCNLNCSYCWQRADDLRNNDLQNSIEHELSPKQWVMTVERLPRFSFLGLSGGEASLSRAFIPILETAKRRRIPVTVNSNGNVLHGKSLEAIITNRIRNLSISLDGFAEDHDKGRNCIGLFDDIVKGLSEFNARRDRSVTKLTIKTVLLNNNHTRLLEFKRFCEKVLLADALNVSFAKEGDHSQFSLKYCQDISSIFHNKSATLYNYQDEDAILSTVYNLLNDRGSCDVTFSHGISSASQARDLLQSKGDKCYKACVLPWALGVVLPDGTVIPCMSVSLGNLVANNYDFVNILRAAKALNCYKIIKSFGTAIPPNCRGCCFLRVR